jgi:hypothetical protein
MSLRWPLVQTRAIQTSEEACFYRNTELQTTSATSATPSTPLWNVLQLSYLAYVGKRARGDLPTVVTLLYPFLLSIDACIDHVCLAVPPPIQEKDDDDDDDDEAERCRTVAAVLSTRRQLFEAVSVLGPIDPQLDFDTTSEFLTLVRRFFFVFVFVFCCFRPIYRPID